MSKPIKRSLILDFIENYAFKCDSCGTVSKPIFICKWCKQPMKLKECHFFHLVPPSRGGAEDISNVIMLCPRCSSKIDLIREKLRTQRNKRLTHY